MHKEFQRHHDASYQCLSGPVPSSSGLAPQEVPVMIAKRRNLFFFFSFSTAQLQTTVLGSALCTLSTDVHSYRKSCIFYKIN